ncbi:energy transducer TonB [Flavobacterium sp. WG21]|uniref:energy transducer TonB n=1 Tax=Flavobacterium sp. WG21 TaxID=1229487 RepID=UPI000346F67D|nr:energy transducer TonB [Flavobacterium sp. WG21]
MKKFLLLLLICFVQITFSQTNKESEKTTASSISNDNTVYDLKGIEEKPEYPGGVTEFTAFLNRNFIKPTEKPNLTGKIYFTFIIEKDGSVSDIKIIRDLGFKTGDEATRVLKSAAKWKPGKHKTKEVRTLNTGVITIS